jgi:hypothetical protein
MRLTKQQLKVLDVLRNGGYIWTAADHPYLARVDSVGRVTSETMHNKTFTTLIDNGIIERGDDRIWRAK